MGQRTSGIRKRLLARDSVSEIDPGHEIDLAGDAIIAYSSEDAAHPVEHLLDGQFGPGATHWCGARPDETEQIVVEFDRPRPVSRLIYEVEEAAVERTQEVHVEVSEDDGSTYRQILVQPYNFSPGGATYEREDYRLNLDRVSHLRLTIVPNKNGSGTASLTALRLFDG